MNRSIESGAAKGDFSATARESKGESQIENRISIFFVGIGDMQDPLTDTILVLRVVA